jgi:hypothetical protein
MTTSPKMDAIKRFGIRIATDKRGRKRAYYFSPMSMRSFPMPIEEAEILIAAEQAIRVDELPRMF